MPDSQGEAPCRQGPAESDRSDTAAEHGVEPMPEGYVQDDVIQSRDAATT